MKAYNLKKYGVENGTLVQYVTGNREAYRVVVYEDSHDYASWLVRIQGVSISVSKHYVSEDLKVYERNRNEMLMRVPDGTILRIEDGFGDVEFVRFTHKQVRSLELSRAEYECIPINESDYRELM